MKKLSTLLLLTCFIGFAGQICFAAIPKKNTQPVVVKTPEPSIRVLIAKDVHAALLEAKGPYEVLREGTKDVLSSGTLGKRFVVQPIDNGLRWGEEYPDDYQITIMPKKPQTEIFVNGMQYTGSVSVYYSKADGISI